MNLDTMTARDLRLLRERVEATIARKQEQAKADLKAKFMTMAADHGMNIYELFNNKPKRSAGNLTRWRDSKTGVEWGGRGRHPQNFDKKRAQQVP